MKKKLLVLVMTGIMTASVLTACGNKEAATTATEASIAETTAAAETTEATETTEAGTTEADTAAEAAAGEDKALTNFDEYLTWTNKEWSAANDEDKLNAAIVYSVYTTEAISGETYDDETKALVIEQMKAADDIKNVVNQLNTTLPSFADKSLKDFADIGVEQINGLMEEATETEAAN